MTTDCRPAACAIATQAAATAVLPEPTSPFKRRFIGAVFSMSWKASQVERRCARVSSKPRPPLKVSMTSCLYGMGVAGSAAMLARMSAKAACSSNSSANAMRRRASRHCSSVSGRCPNRTASAIGSKWWRSRTRSGSRSSSLTARGRVESIHPAIFFELRPSTRWYFGMSPPTPDGDGSSTPSSSFSWCGFCISNIPL